VSGVGEMQIAGISKECSDKEGMIKKRRLNQ
jgi:hypothetical protein